MPTKRASSAGPAEGPSRRSSSSVPTTSAYTIIASSVLFPLAILFLGWLAYFVAHAQHTQHVEVVHHQHHHHQHHQYYHHRSPTWSFDFGPHGQGDELAFGVTLLVLGYIAMRVMETIELALEVMSCAAAISANFWLCTSVSAYDLPFLPPLVLPLGKVVLVLSTVAWCVARAGRLRWPLPGAPLP
jgi:hypothetical protein